MLTLLIAAGMLAAAQSDPAPGSQVTDSLATDAAPIEVMVLGTYHFTGGGQDLHNADVDDHLAPERQREIEAVVDALASFDPDKIMVELTPEHEAGFNETYRAYRAGEHTLTVNERQQLGMRLAARLGHEQLYAVDYQNGMDFEAMLGAAQANEQDRLLAEFENFNARIPAMMSRFETGPVSERLRGANAPETAQLHSVYLTLAQMGSVEDPVGAHQMGNWWERNLVIFSRIAAHSEPGERILVIYGSGHTYLLEQFFGEAPGFDLVDPLSVLP